MKTIIKICAGIFLIALIPGCVSTSEEIPVGLSPEELIQQGQEFSDRNRYDRALQYYETVLERFAGNIDSVCAAEYEIAFIHYKQKKFETAKEEFNALIARYDTPDEELLPPQFKKLALIVLERLSQDEK
ncbi:MAG: tetratricopeptide repeat protein [Treponema sp.]|jgi:outer membrane protein assembly factor BamD (BamD/ComL family)|nr:tetratricopeptide repeat protein [Treponema sp.]